MNEAVKIIISLLPAVVASIGSILSARFVVKFVVKKFVEIKDKVDEGAKVKKELSDLKNDLVDSSRAIRELTEANKNLLKENEKLLLELKGIKTK